MTLIKKRPLPGCLQTVVRSGDAPKPPFPIKTSKKSKNSGNQPQINHRNYPLFLSLPFFNHFYALFSKSQKVKNGATPNEALALPQTRHWRCPQRGTGARMGFFTKNRWFPCFGSKYLSNPKYDMMNNDARHHFYPFGCPKPIISLLVIEKSKKWVKFNPNSKYFPYFP